LLKGKNHRIALLPLPVPAQPATPKNRHLDRSNGQPYRPLRSGETPAFFAFAVAIACSLSPKHKNRHLDPKQLAFLQARAAEKPASPPQPLPHPKLNL
jgi:hypothetical protein